MLTTLLAWIASSTWRSLATLTRLNSAQAQVLVASSRLSHDFRLARSGAIYLDTEGGIGSDWTLTFQVPFDADGQQRWDENGQTSWQAWMQYRWRASKRELDVYRSDLLQPGWQPGPNPGRLLRTGQPHVLARNLDSGALIYRSEGFLRWDFGLSSRTRKLRVWSSRFPDSTETTEAASPKAAAWPT